MQMHSGDNCPKSGTYKVVGPNGEDMGKLYMNEGETFPPTQQSGCYYEQVQIFVNFTGKQKERSTTYSALFYTLKRKRTVSPSRMT